MKIYTKRGDRGRTILADGREVEKSHCLVESVGVLDELNASLGLLLAKLEAMACRKGEPILPIDFKLLKRAQKNCFFIGAVVAQVHPEVVKRISSGFSADETLKLEARIDYHSSNLGPLKHFILPGGSEVAARAHWVRACCRRAERRLVSPEVEMSSPLSANIQQYLNRLSDYLFVLARVFNRVCQHDEIIWRGDK